MKPKIPHFNTTSIKIPKAEKNSIRVLDGVLNLCLQNWSAIQYGPSAQELAFLFQTITGETKRHSLATNIWLIQNGHNSFMELSRYLWRALGVDDVEATPKKIIVEVKQILFS